VTTLFAAAASCSLTYTTTHQTDRHTYTRARTPNGRVAKLTHTQKHTRAQRKRKIGPTKNKQKQLKIGVVGNTNFTLRRSAGRTIAHFIATLCAHTYTQH